VKENLTGLGNAVVHTTWSEWLPSVLTTPRLRELLGPDWDRYRRTPDATVRYRFAAARLPIKYTAAAALGIPPEYLDLAYRLGGRPYLRGFDQIELSLSHTGDLMAVGPLHGTHEPPFYVAGSDHWVAGYMEGAVRTGRAAARAILER